jgi:cytosine deaminase
MYLSHQAYLVMAVEEAFRGKKAGAPAEAAVLVIDGMVESSAHRQAGNQARHAVIACLDAAGDVTPEAYGRSTVYLTNAPCPRCLGRLIREGIPLVVIASEVECIETAGGMEVRRMPMDRREWPGGWRFCPGDTCQG